MFSGNTVEWMPFYDSFKAAIANNSSLGNVQKLQYLRSQLQGEALLAIEGLQLTDANYDNAIEILMEQYGRPEKIKAAHMKAIWELKSSTHDHKGLKEFSDSLESNLRGLSALGTSENSIEDLLVPLILEKIPPSVRQFMTREHGSSVWTLKELKISLKKEIDVMQVGETSLSMNEEHTPISPTAAFITNHCACQHKSCENQSNSETVPILVSNSTQRSEKKPVKCIFCSNDHPSTSCNIVTNIDERFQIIKQKRRCFNCFGNHLSKVNLLITK